MGSWIGTDMAQFTDNPAIAEGASIYQATKQLLHSYLRTIILLSDYTILDDGNVCMYIL